MSTGNEWLAFLLLLAVLFAWGVSKQLERVEAALKRLEQALRDLAARH